MKNSVGLLVGALLLLSLTRAGAHHSAAAEFDSSRTIEVSGIVETISWRNPHGRMEFRDADNNLWRVELPAMVILRILGISADLIAEGDRVTVAGAPGRRDANAMLGGNILLASGYELAFGNNIPHFPAGRNGNLIGRSFDQSNVDEAIARADGIFRVWSTNMRDPAAFPMFKGGYPLNDAGRAELAKWDPADNALLYCGSKGMPLIMITPAPIEFVREGSTILMRIEEYDSRRSIHLDPAAVAPAEPTQMGFSRGRFEGETLVVETTGLRAQYFDPDGAPQSEGIRLVERFTPNADYSRLDYRITVTDPAYYTEPFELTRYFVWKPEMSVASYDCLDRDW